MQRLAAVNGLVALVGSESYLVQVRNPLIWDQVLQNFQKNNVCTPFQSIFLINCSKIIHH